MLQVEVMNNNKQFVSNIFFILTGNFGIYYFFANRLMSAYLQLTTGLLTIYLMYYYQVQSQFLEFNLSFQIITSLILLVNIILWIEVIIINYKRIDIILTKG